MILSVVCFPPHPPPAYFYSPEREEKKSTLNNSKATELTYHQPAARADIYSDSNSIGDVGFIVFFRGAGLLVGGELNRIDNSTINPW